MAETFLRILAVVAGEPLAACAISAHSTRAINLYRHTGECAENPEQLQCIPFNNFLRVSVRVRMGLITCTWQLPAPVLTHRASNVLLVQAPRPRSANEPASIYPA